MAIGSQFTTDGMRRRSGMMRPPAWMLVNCLKANWSTPSSDCEANPTGSIHGTPGAVLTSLGRCDSR